MAFWNRQKNKANDTRHSASNTNGRAPAVQFYNDCVEDYHNTANKQGLAKRGLIFIPELIPIGEKTVLAFLKDPFFNAQFGSNPQMYYYIMGKENLWGRFALRSKLRIALAGKVWYDDKNKLFPFSNMLLLLL